MQDNFISFSVARHLRFADLFQKSEQIGMYNVQSSICVSFVNDARNVDFTRACSCQSLNLKDWDRFKVMLVRTLGYHFDINIILPEHTEETSGNADHVLQLLSYKTDDGHVGYEIHVPVLA